MARLIKIGTNPHRGNSDKYGWTSIYQARDSNKVIIKAYLGLFPTQELGWQAIDIANALLNGIHEYNYEVPIIPESFTARIATLPKYNEEGFAQQLRDLTNDILCIDTKIATTVNDYRTKLRQVYKHKSTTTTSASKKARKYTPSSAASADPAKIIAPKSSSRYTGVFWNTEKQNWIANYHKHKKPILLRRYQFEEDAALAYLNTKIEDLEKERALIVATSHSDRKSQQKQSKLTETIANLRNRIAELNEELVKSGGRKTRLPLQKNNDKQHADTTSTSKASNHFDLNAVFNMHGFPDDHDTNTDPDILLESDTELGRLLDLGNAAPGLDEILGDLFYDVSEPMIISTGSNRNPPTPSPNRHPTKKLKPSND